MTIAPTQLNEHMGQQTFVHGIPDTLRTMAWRGAWAASTAYYFGDVVLQGGVVYVCTVAHTSGTTFSATDWTAFPSSGGGSSYTIGAWQTITVSGSGNTGTVSGYGTFRYRLEGTDVVRLAGAVSVATSGTIATLPYHPTGLIFPVVGLVGVGASVLELTTGGAVVSFGTGTYVVDGLTYTTT